MPGHARHIHSQGTATENAIQVGQKIATYYIASSASRLRARGQKHHENSRQQVANFPNDLGLF
jgi:hypothetical protein